MALVNECQLHLPIHLLSVSVYFHEVICDDLYSKQIPKVRTSALFDPALVQTTGR